MERGFWKSFENLFYRLLSDRICEMFCWMQVHKCCLGPSMDCFLKKDCCKTTLINSSYNPTEEKIEITCKKQSFKQNL